MPTSEFPLYDHQVEALRNFFVEGRNLVVATGTASGKTEIFLLAILGQLVRDALNWPAPIRAAAAVHITTRSSNGCIVACTNVAALRYARSSCIR